VAGDGRGYVSAQPGARRAAADLVEQGIQSDFGTTGPVAVYGKPNLLPAITWNAEIDYDRQLPTIASVLRTALFAQRTDNVIATPFGGPITFAPAGYAITTAPTSATAPPGNGTGDQSHRRPGGGGTSATRWRDDRSHESEHRR